MATMDELRRALVAAHQAGNVDDARKLAAAIQSMQSAPLPDAQSPDYAQGAQAASAYPDEARKLVLDRETAKMPWLARFGQAGVDEAVNLGQGVTFGWAPHASAFMDKMLTGADYNESLTKFQDMAKNSEVRGGLAGKVAHGVGNVGAMTLLSQLGINPATYVASGGTAIGAPLLGRMAAGAMESAGMGAAENAANGRPLDLGMNAALGAATVPVAGAIGKALGWAGSRILPTSWGGGHYNIPPSGEDMKDATKAAYEKWNQSGAKIWAADVLGTVDNTRSAIRAELTPTNARPHLDALNKIERDITAEIDRTGSLYVEPKTLENLRRIWGKNVPNDAPLYGEFYKQWDDMIVNKAGSAADLAQAARNASRQEQSLRAYDKKLSQLRAGGEASVNQGAARYMMNSDERRYLSPEAQAALETAANNTALGQAAQGVVGALPRTLSPWALASGLGFLASGGNPGVMGAVAAGYPAARLLSASTMNRESVKAANAARNAIAGVPNRVEGGFTDEMAQAATPMERFLRSLIMQHANEVGPDALLPSLFTHQPSR